MIEVRKEIRIAGFGGQGVILAGIVLGKAASLYDGLYAVQTQSYGPEARGGASRAEVVISDHEIDYPKVQSPDILVAMSHQALLTYMDDLKRGGTLIVDPDMVVEAEIEDFIRAREVKYFRAPATRTAEERVGITIVANMVMIGALTEATGIVSVRAAEEAIKDSVPPGTEEKNLMAFQAGRELIMEGSR
ncbi:MAG: 2-oxoglutarate ferredoxin oxidoreductase subunit gamma [Methanothermobacter sp.]|jgi:2-oxoglutarate ferredoxin oxidoreductase subunit gamma|uniref:2-oxoglutarate ferredoxin oxidoreductase gamma subunit n=2 Tax=Methanothermobacter TaxID=145260 RepID=A0A371NEI9_9EURY|nr:2-oxoglutarate ferredoxin oxidoreductase subunit gamma [Methanothermobacter sp.]REE28326.1 2-oxoglutarate ferredoxin oxidoreductase gamma subunit [Methanothermobacter defluvii]HIH64140.1 2-oxoacid:ferredoxin oxidoreductase subunit gamma [Methanothermobacter thermautotrophicus]MDN5374758.1 2-oxoglutarate ferredoxin oxidoreductase subunit gamma [Methanothermobacter sp.]NLU04799.1 2-oxoacid:ferredoxin oxidoreductase subunit gamma [Methanothermobacter sp.]